MKGISHRHVEKYTHFSWRRLNNNTAIKRRCWGDAFTVAVVREQKIPNSLVEEEARTGQRRDFVTCLRDNPRRWLPVRHRQRQQRYQGERGRRRGRRRQTNVLETNERIASRPWDPISWQPRTTSLFIDHSGALRRRASTAQATAGEPRADRLPHYGTLPPTDEVIAPRYFPTRGALRARWRHCWESELRRSLKSPRRTVGELSLGFEFDGSATLF